MARTGTPVEVSVSPREAEVLTAVGEHLTNVEIGSRLFISTRTVESHVSSLLRKLQVSDRRALAVVAGSAPATRREVSAVAAGLPSPLTPFVGRIAERAALVEALAEHRLVTAVGPGGIGKTRLALRVANEVADRFADGVWYVDLVPVTDPVMIGAAIADALGLGEQPGRSAVENVLGWFAEREAMLVLDNCEHLLDGVVVVLERLLTGSPGLVVLATSRSRLLVPFEWVFPVPGLSVDTDEGGSGDAVELFLERAAAGGRAVTFADRKRIAAVCSGLDGMALAIELAAARFASLGLDGLEAGLGDRLRLLTGGRRIDDRHRSLRSTLDWSYALLDEASQALLRRVCVFAGPFTAAAAASVLGEWAPVPTGAVPTILSALADQSLLIATAERAGTRYRALETIRQYGFERLEEADEAVETRSRHLTWCLARCEALQASFGRAVEVACLAEQNVAFDLVADELRWALGWASAQARYRAEAYQLAFGVAELSFTRGTPGEAQRRYEQAADLALDDLAAAEAFRGAAGAAESRHVGNDAMRLRQCAADAALRAGDRAGAARDLARNAELIHRAPGLMATAIEPGRAAALVAEGWALAGDDVRAQARLLTAESFDFAITDEASEELVARALVLARRADDPLTESAALDQLTSLQLARGEVGAAAASALRRTEVLAALPVTATAGLELSDSFVMLAECGVAAGDLRGARAAAERLRDLPFYREEGHLAAARLMLVTALTGDWDEAVALADRFCEGWERAGRPRAGNLSRGAYAAATVHGLRGNDDARREWLENVDRLSSPGRIIHRHYAEFFDALLLLHRGQAEQAVRVMFTAPEGLTEWHNGMWRPWYAALWAEAAALTGRSDDARIERARAMAAGNPVACAIVDRAAVLAARYANVVDGNGNGNGSRNNDSGGGRDGLAAAATALQNAGCTYQWARTLVFMGGDERAQGESVLAAMGATPMAVPPE